MQSNLLLFLFLIFLGSFRNVTIVPKNLLKVLELTVNLEKAFSSKNKVFTIHKIHGIVSSKFSNKPSTGLEILLSQILFDPTISKIFSYLV